MHLSRTHSVPSAVNCFGATDLGQVGILAAILSRGRAEPDQGRKSQQPVLML